MYHPKLMIEQEIIEMSKVDQTLGQVYHLVVGVKGSGREGGGGGEEGGIVLISPSTYEQGTRISRFFRSVRRSLTVGVDHDFGPKETMFGPRKTKQWPFSASSRNPNYWTGSQTVLTQCVWKHSVCVQGNYTEYLFSELEEKKVKFKSDRWVRSFFSLSSRELDGNMDQETSCVTLSNSFCPSTSGDWKQNSLLPILA